jgi:hypothetical protein
MKITQDLPGTIPPISTHPRRVPAHASVSLVRHSPPARKGGIGHQPTSWSDKANPSSVSPRLSNESSDAGKWFESANNDARPSVASFNDDEPPFLLRNPSSSETPPEGHSGHYAHGAPTIPYRPGMARFDTDGSSTEDFRSVIDDLTIANKKLKQKLRKYEKVHDAHLQDDKLFEVKIHGLPDHKKKELQDLLRKFAAGLDDGVTTDYPQISSHAPALDQRKSTSSTSRFAESGYASMSASGLNSSVQSNQASNQPNDHRKMTRSAYDRQQQSIQSYLHDIPAGLLPSNNAAMSDRTKRKMVVRRLEQIFAGKHSMPGNHLQPRQQEEVAQSAANADRQERQATGRHSRPEGLRVARIVPDNDEMDVISDQDESLQKLRPSLQIAEQDFSGAGSPDQRPTRPLDLDPSRAQVPVENMEYIRHLGFTPPDMNTGDAPSEGHGWLYLNLLINMAQLHTLNVTPEFVKDALTEYSSQLELSQDGRKIRWKGGLDVTRHSSDSASEFSGNSPCDQGSPAKRQKLDQSGSHDESHLTLEERARRLARTQREEAMNKFAYTPMIFKRQESEEDDEGYGFEIESSCASLQRPHHAGESSRLSSSAVQSGPSTSKGRQHGPMIFYTKAKFCTDLSGDQIGSSIIPSGAYKAVTSHPLGATQHSCSFRGSDIAETRGPLDRMPMDIDTRNGSRAGSSVGDFGFSPAALGNDNGDDTPTEFMEFEASGLGGVQPDDNFAIHVRRSQTQTRARGSIVRQRPIIYPRSIANALSTRPSSDVEPTSHTGPQRVISEEIISASRKPLPTSVLPPASFLPFDSTSSADVDSNLDDSDASSEADSESRDGPATALQHLNVQHDDTDSESEEESDYSDDDGSVDLLATARQLDPNTVRTQEREYDAEVADRLAAEIVAGSSAATAGGGSGFNSPADGMPHLDRGDSPRKNTSIARMSSQ